MYLFSLFLSKVLLSSFNNYKFLDELKSIYNTDNSPSTNLETIINIIASQQLLYVCLKLKTETYKLSADVTNPLHDVEKYKKVNETEEKILEILETKIDNFKYDEIELIMDFIYRKLYFYIFSCYELENDIFEKIYRHIFYPIKLAKGSLKVRQVYDFYANDLERSNLPEPIKSSILRKLDQIKFIADKTSYTEEDLIKLIQTVYSIE